ncbi:hypothetical protein [Paenibacillus pabuli]|uniref:hypothetical protein n=1 Tax=Paenibacillus pabuli TaxID=1472 RepID=UPI000783876B|nr:hypothetical protein [Paenibacillus pabuli]MEC0129125.1 hypothetical protein [Paenibacillus pabuli]
MTQSREEILMVLAQNYYEFLCSLPFENKLYMIGINEGKNKFLTILHIHLLKKNISMKPADKHFTTDYISPLALKVLKSGKRSGLRYEHLVPKQKYIQKPCEDLAKENRLTIEFIYDQLEKYLWTATITEQEEKLLTRTNMPKEWDNIDIKARYYAVGIELIEHQRDFYL